MNDFDFADFGRRLKHRLAGPLPGVDAQIRLSPEPRYGWVPGHLPASARPGAGLLLLYPKQGSLHTVLTLRNAELQQHAGQLSLPGGGVEAGESLAEAALREANEEIGLAVDAVEVLGTLSPLYIPVSGFALHPVVAIAAEPLTFAPDPAEVQRLYEVAIEQLRDPGRRGEESREHEGRNYRVPFVHVGDQKLWGATAMAVSEMLEVLDSLDGGDVSMG
jgi:8-oxo-dGTP pyrophosphatase MutT (NUDIX family)